MTRVRVEQPKVVIEEQQRQHAKEAMRTFFRDKKHMLVCKAGETPERAFDRIVMTSQNVQIVVDSYDLNFVGELINNAVEKHLKACKKQGLPRKLRHASLEARHSDAELNLRLVRECHQLDIGKEFIGGVLLLYYWLFEGVEFK